MEVSQFIVVVFSCFTVTFFDRNKAQNIPLLLRCWNADRLSGRTDIRCGGGTRSSQFTPKPTVSGFENPHCHVSRRRSKLATMKKGLEPNSQAELSADGIIYPGAAPHSHSSPNRAVKCPVVSPPSLIIPCKYTFTDTNKP